MPLYRYQTSLDKDNKQTKASLISEVGREGLLSMTIISLLDITRLQRNIGIWYQTLQSREPIPPSLDRDFFFLKSKEGMTLVRRHWFLTWMKLWFILLLFPVKMRTILSILMMNMVPAKFLFDTGQEHENSLNIWQNTTKFASLQHQCQAMHLL